MLTSKTKKYFWNTVAYVLLGLSVFWGTLLAVFSLRTFFQSYVIAREFFQLVFAVIGMIAWVNAFHYHKKILKTDALTIWKKFFAKNKVLLLVSGTVTIMVIVLRVLSFSINFHWIIQLVHIGIGTPWAIGEFFKMLLEIHINRFLPLLSPLNFLLWILPAAFELVVVLYVARFFGRIWEKIKG